MARSSLLCADVPLRNYSLTHAAEGGGKGTQLHASLQTDSNDSADLISSITTIIVDTSCDALSRSIDLSCSDLSVDFSISSTANAVFAMKTNSVYRTFFESPDASTRMSTDPLLLVSASVSKSTRSSNDAKILFRVSQ